MAVIEPTSAPASPFSRVRSAGLSAAFVPPPLARNHGPCWGFRFLLWADRRLPAALFRFATGVGVWVAVATLPRQRAFSRTYLSLVKGRPASLVEVWRHFFAFSDFLLLKLRVSTGRPHRCTLVENEAAFRTLAASGQQALFGTFHLGHSDLLGYLLGEFKRRTHIVRFKMENSGDTERLGARFGEWVSFIWVNDAASLLFTLKDALGSGGSLALKCDRLGFSSKLEAFDFLGASRLFPFTLYHLALIFRLPVILCVGTPGPDGGTLVHSSPVFTPGDQSREAELDRARIHFQAFLRRVEALLHADPYLWSNYTELNPVVPAG